MLSVEKLRRRGSPTITVITEGTSDNGFPLPAEMNSYRVVSEQKGEFKYQRESGGQATSYVADHRMMVSGLVPQPAGGKKVSVVRGTWTAGDESAPGARRPAQLELRHYHSYPVDTPVYTMLYFGGRG